MGLKIWDLIPRREIEINELSGKILAVDASPVLYQFLSSIRQSDGTPLMDSHGNITSHLMGIFTRITRLIQEDIKLIFCFDGKIPALKYQETESREAKKLIAEEKLKEAIKSEDKDLMLKYSKQSIRLDKNIINESKELLNALGIPVIQSPGEAEAQCSFIAERGHAFGVVSQDADALLYSTPILIRNLTISQRRKLPSGAYISIKPELIELKNVLSTLNLNQDQLLALAILTGTDYNKKGVKGIGPKTALKLVKEYKNFDVLFKNVNADFNWKKIYAVFKSMPIMKNYQLKWKEIDIYRLKKILVDQHDFSEERIDKTLSKLKEKDSKKHQKSLSDF